MVLKSEKRDVYQAFAKRLMDACAKDPTMPKAEERSFLKALGQRVGIGYKGAEKWKKGDGMPDMGNAVLLATSLGVSFEWLMTGRGPMSIEESIAPQFSRVAESKTHYYGFREEEVLISKRIAKLPEKTRIALIQLIDTLPQEN